jgi:hypothetical protein
MPKSVKSPVRWVVRTLEFEIVVTKEFCKPIAKSKVHAIVFGLLNTQPFPKIATKNNNIHSIEVGTI